MSDRIALRAWDVDLALGGATVLAVVSIAVVVLLLIGGAVDGWMIELTAAELGIAGRSSIRPTAVRLATARAIAHLPLVAVLVALLGPIVAVTYGELTLPGDLGTPIAIRVAESMPIPIGIVLVTAVLCDALGALAVRAVALSGASIVGSIGQGSKAIARRPVDAAIAAIASLAVLVILVVPALIAAGIAFEGLRGLSAGDSNAPAIVLAVILLVASWMGGLLLAGIACAWRSYAWTSVHVRAIAPRV